MSIKNSKDANESIFAAEVFLLHAEQHKAANNAVDALSRMYYACFHSMKAYLYTMKSRNIMPNYLGHSELRTVYYNLYKSNQPARAFTFRKKPNDTIKAWQQLREDMDYRIKTVKFSELLVQDVRQYDLMKIFTEQHISFIKGRIAKQPPTSSQPLSSDPFKL